ncbi:YheC/YheD family protein [Paenactinomyces guangxiensis]|uniref:YheC/YheD family protein n=1 Tax=Paenactinomyces guangxiensis TaxID=1490290 RepID=A0A7W1WQX8_9BACL|nr:YheC/YheD family protein [Paenactinomyces guangxiensis]MBA4494453.1 YheC/YheD family protein [Paenactinomyces guangxiensis]MBH8591492.1 YheC/YheD family protein [Paenactinomyces guangxiensis]
MANTVGVLISRHIFPSCLRGRSPYESFALYSLYAKQEGLRVIFFTIDHLLMPRFLVQGYEQKDDGSFVQRTVPIPRVIHNRIKPSAPLPEFKQLKNIPEITLFNRDNRLDKWKVYQALVSDRVLHPYLPETCLLNGKSFEEMKDRYPALYLKPRDKSLGMGVRRLDFTDSAIEVAHAMGQRESIAPGQQNGWLQKCIRREPMLIQQSIDLIKQGQQPIDFRVAVQRGRNGEWKISGIVARVGPAGGIATNVAVGGRARQLMPTLENAGITKPEPLIKEIGRIVLRAADCLQKTYPGLADLGFDIAVDQTDRVWIIEVNGRDLRITFRQAQDWEAWRRTFATPMEYAGYLLKKQMNPHPDKPTVAIVTPGNLPVSSNGSGSVEISAREIAKRVSKHHQVYLVGKEITPMGKVHVVEAKPPSRGGYLNQVAGKLRLLDPDIIQVENRPLWIERFKRVAPRTKKVLFLHSETFLQPPYAKPKQIKRTLPQYDLILTNSKFMQHRLTRQFPKMAPKIKSVWLGVDLNHFASIHDKAVREQRLINRKHHGLHGCPVILFVGRIIPKKGVHHLIDAFLRVHSEYSNAILIIVGSSYYGKNIETPYVRNLKEKSKPLGTHIRWWPFTSHHQLPSIYQMADILVTPSICKEAFGLVNVEGMATGLPILTTKTGGISEVVVDGVNGRLLPVEGLTDGIVRVLSEWLRQPQRLKQMGIESRRRAEALFGWERVAEDLSRIYQAL